MNNKIKGFIIAEIILYIVFLTLDCASVDLSSAAAYVKFASILFCAAMSILIFIENKTIEGLFIMLGLSFTLAADYYLIFTDRYIYGIISFIIVQVIYLNKLLWSKKLKYKIGFIVLIFMLWNIAMLLIKGIYVLEPIAVLALLYIVTFLTNIAIAAVTLYKKRTIENKMFLAALILFLMCDLNVGLVNIDTAQLSFSLSVSNLNYILIWFFYLPSQVLFVLFAALKGNSCKY